jgi:hypothetical protein
MLMRASEYFIGVLPYAKSLEVKTWNWIRVSIQSEFIGSQLFYIMVCFECGQLKLG